MWHFLMPATFSNSVEPQCVRVNCRLPALWNVLGGDGKMWILTSLHVKLVVPDSASLSHLPGHIIKVSFVISLSRVLSSLISSGIDSLKYGHV